jgi:P4 family phage/plasmid primase-like protien
MTAKLAPEVTFVNIDRYRTSLSLPDTCRALGIKVNGSGFIHTLEKPAENNPSLKIYEDHAYDFSSGKRYDSIALVRAKKGLAFREALRWIARETGLPEPRSDPEAQARYEAVQTVSDAYAIIYHDALKNPERALAYLEGRGVSRATTNELVGYLPPKYQPPDPEAAKRAGLYSEKTGNFLFLDRLVIPIVDRGRIVSLYGRALDNKRIPKHIYPATTDPPMPAAIWNLDSCRGEKELFFAESIIDALTLKDRGFKNIAGLFGTQGLTDDRLESLKRTQAEKIILVFDTDRKGSGQAGAMKAGEKLFRAVYDVRILELPLADNKEKTDPNSFFHFHTADDFRALESRDFFSRKLDTIPERGTPQEKYKTLAPVLELVSTQPELTWKGYVERIANNFPEFDRRTLEKEIRQNQRSSRLEDEEDSKFLPLSFVERIRDESPVICFDGRAYRYEGGVYAPWYPEEIDQKTIELYGPEVQTKHLDAVRKTLMSVCFVRPDQVNPREILNLKNGILDLSSGSFEAHSPALLSTVQSETAFDANADCPLWLKTIEEILPDPDSRHLLAQIFGYCLTADIAHQKGFIFYGDGGNGKSVVTDVLEALLGRENCSALHLSDFKERFRLAELQNRLVNFSTEVEAKGLVNDARIKSVITGDPVMAERKNKDPFRFRPFVKLIVSCNNLPQTTDKSAGYFRRWIILPYSQTFGGKTRDSKRAETIIKTELSGVLNWGTGGFKSLKDAGEFLEPDTSREALEEYRRDTDATIAFVEECIRKLPGGTAPLKEVFSTYKEWMKEANLEALGRTNFSKAIKRTLNIKDLPRGEHGNYIPGVVLRP